MARSEKQLYLPLRDSICHSGTSAIESAALRHMHDDPTLVPELQVHRINPALGASRFSMEPA